MKKVRSLNRININEEDIDLQRIYVTFEKYSCGENKKKLCHTLDHKLILWCIWLQFLTRYGDFLLGVVHKLRGPIFDLFWPPTYLSWTFVDIWCTTYPLSTWTYKNLITYLGMYNMYLVLQLLLSRWRWGYNFNFFQAFENRAKQFDGSM